MGGILDKLDEWLRGLLIEGITGNLSGMFDTVNTKVDSALRILERSGYLHSLKLWDEYIPYKKTNKIN